MNLENLEMLETAIEHLGPLLDEVVFVGGANLLGTKLEAFATRGRSDFLGSRDFSDLVTLIDGREELSEDVATASEQLQDYIGDQLRRLARQKDFDRGLEGALPSSPESRGRVDRVIWPRVRQLMIAGAVSELA